jgi:cellobiose phosphorylase
MLPGSRTTRSSTTSRRAGSSSTPAAAGARATCARARRAPARARPLGPRPRLLLRVFATQNPDGDWPQWFTFFERDRGIRAGDSHGDIVFWPLLALAQYLLARGRALLDAVCRSSIPTATSAASAGRSAPRRARARVDRPRGDPRDAPRRVRHGDWNDSLQPADPAMRERSAARGR